MGSSAGFGVPSSTPRGMSPIPRSELASVRTDLHSDLVGNVSSNVISFPAKKRQQQRFYMLWKVRWVGRFFFADSASRS